MVVDHMLTAVGIVTPQIEAHCLNASMDPFKACEREKDLVGAKERHTASSHFLRSVLPPVVFLAIHCLTCTLHISCAHCQSGVHHPTNNLPARYSVVYLR